MSKYGIRQTWKDSKPDNNAKKKETGLTWDGLSDYTGISSPALRNYSKEKSPMSESVGEALEKATGILSDYWRGLSDARTEREHWAEVEAAEYAAMDEYHKEEKAERESRCKLFRRFGFEFADLSHTPDHAFGSLPPFKLTSTSTPALSAGFDESELADMFKQIQATIEFAVFKQTQKGL